MSAVDFGRHSDDYAAYRPGPPASFYDRLDRVATLDGCACLDLATGPGTVALELAARGATVVGVDTAESQIAAATCLARERRLAGATQFRVARAEDTGCDAHAFDLVTAGQCWHWFDAAAAMTEVRRVLRPGGVFAIVYYSYLAAHSPVVRDTEELVLAFNPTWPMAGWTGMFPELVDELIHAGFTLVEQFCYDHDEPFSHVRWRGRIRTCNGVGSGGLSATDVRRFDEALRRLLTQKYAEPLSIPHRVWCVVGRVAPS